MHSYNIVLLIVIYIFSVYVIQEVFLLYQYLLWPWLPLWPPFYFRPLYFCLKCLSSIFWSKLGKGKISLVLECNRYPDITISDPALTVNIAGSLPVDELVEANRETIITCIADANPPSTLNIVVTDKLGNVQTSSKVAAEHSLTISLGREYDGASIVCLADPENIFSEILKYEVMCKYKSIFNLSNSFL